MEAQDEREREREREGDAGFLLGTNNRKVFLPGL